MYITRKPGSDMLIQEFFARLGLENLWLDFRAKILGQTNPFVFTLFLMVILFFVGYSANSKSLQIVSALIFFSMIILKIMII